MAANHMPVPVSDPGLVTTRRPVPALTPRQAEVLRLAALGFTYDEIGLHLGIARTTVRDTLWHVYDRLDVGCLVEALAAVGWLVVPEQVAGVDRRYAA